MAKKTAPQKAGKKPHHHAAVAEHFDDLVVKRRARRRVDGDGKGQDVGIGLVGKKLEAILDGLNKPTKAAMLKHISHHVDEAMRPVIRAIEKSGDEFELTYFKSVGPNMLRTILEFLEDESKK